MVFHVIVITHLKCACFSFIMSLFYMHFHIFCTFICFKYNSLCFYWHPVCFMWDHRLYLFLVCLCTWLCPVLKFYLLNQFISLILSLILFTYLYINYVLTCSCSFICLCMGLVLFDICALIFLVFVCYGGGLHVFLMLYYYSVNFLICVAICI